jgi:hypothetical protein
VSMPLPQIAILPTYRLLFSRAFWWVCATKVYSGRTHRYPVKRERGVDGEDGKTATPLPSKRRPTRARGERRRRRMRENGGDQRESCCPFSMANFWFAAQAASLVLPSLRVMVEGQR